jgi:hypothetical protein
MKPWEMIYKEYPFEQVIPCIQNTYSHILKSLVVSLSKGSSTTYFFLVYAIQYQLGKDFKNHRVVSIPYSTLEEIVKTVNKIQDTSLVIPSRPAISRSIQLLLQNKTLARKRPRLGEYWVNCADLFNGSRD